MNKTDSLLRTCVVPVQHWQPSRDCVAFSMFSFFGPIGHFILLTQNCSKQCLLVNWLDICVTFLVEVSVNGFANELNICLFSCVASIHIHFECVCVCVIPSNWIIKLRTLWHVTQYIIIIIMRWPGVSCSWSVPVFAQVPFSVVNFMLQRQSPSPSDIDIVTLSLCS